MNETKRKGLLALIGELQSKDYDIADEVAREAAEMAKEMAQVGMPDMKLIYEGVNRVKYDAQGNAIPYGYLNDDSGNDD